MCSSEDCPGNGDLTCTFDETCENYTRNYCGDGEGSETPTLGGSCGNGNCQANKGENADTCPEDCTEEPAPPPADDGCSSGTCPCGNSGNCKSNCC